MRDTRGTTRVVAILGDPVEHSRSPAMHNAAFEALGLDYVYVALRVRPGDLGRAVAGARALGFAGWNVTVPYKERIIPLLDRVSATARAIGAVNTVSLVGHQLIGDNTDAEGFRRAIAKLAFRPRGKSAVLLGAGGSARAVAYALSQAGVGRLTILNRTRARALALARQMRAIGRSEVIVGSLGSARAAAPVREADLVVNCTSLGLDGRTIPPIPIAETPAHCLFYDLVYGPERTPLVRLAEQLGRRAEDGRTMLLEQAGLAFHLWTGRRAPLGTMERALFPSGALPA